jgi:hypothetical protein
MIINRKNYELFVLDYLEGRLSSGDELQMKQFLSCNPDIQEELIGIETSFNLSESSVTINKSSLYKSFNDIPSVSPENFEEFCVAYYEGDLDVKSASLLEEYIGQQPVLRALFDLHGKLKYIPDLELKYPKKGSLKKLAITRGRRIIYSAITAIAASIVVILFLNLPGHRHPVEQLISQEGLHGNVRGSSPAIEKSTKTKHTFLRSKSTAKIHFKGIVKQIAAVDSTNSRQHEKVVLASMQPMLPSLKDILPDPVVDIHQVTNDPLDSGEIVMQDSSPINSQADKSSRNIKARNTLLWNVLHFGINSINSLTENDLALRTEKNSAGKLSEIELQSDNFEISRKIGRNMQN